MTRSRAYLPLSQNFGEHSVGFSRTTYAHFPLVKNLVSYWPLIEGAGAAVKDYWGSNNGTLNQTDHWCLGRWGNAYDFDGVDDYIIVIDDPSLRLTNNFTIAFWMKAANLTQTNKYILSKNNFYAILWEYVNNTVEFFALGFAGPDNPRVGSQIVVADTDWHYIVYAYDGSTWMGYKDGKEVFSLIKTFTLGTSADPLSIGCTGVPSNWSAFFNGILDEICIWNRGLKRSEIVSMLWRRREG